MTVVMHLQNSNRGVDRGYKRSGLTGNGSGWRVLRCQIKFLSVSVAVLCLWRISYRVLSE